MDTSIRPIPQFSVRWAEPNGIRTRTHSLDVQVRGESGGSVPLLGAVTSHTEDNLGPIPLGGSQSETRFLRDAAHLDAVADIWNQVKRDRIEKWIPRAPADAGRLHRDEIELVVTRGANDVQRFRTGLDDAPQPIRDLLSAAAKLHTDTRLGTIDDAPPAG